MIVMIHIHINAHIYQHRHTYLVKPELRCLHQQGADNLPLRLGDLGAVEGISEGLVLADPLHLRLYADLVEHSSAGIIAGLRIYGRSCTMQYMIYLDQPISADKILFHPNSSKS